MARSYWLDLFTDKTWSEFLANGANVSGSRATRKATAQRIKPGDFFLCYITGISRFIGVLEVKSEYYYDETEIWKDEIFPCRFKVKLISQLTLDNAIPLGELYKNLTAFKHLNSKSTWGGFLRGSPNKFQQGDGEVLVKLIEDTINNPISRPIDNKKLNRKSKVYKSKVGPITVPDEIEDTKYIDENIEKETNNVSHQEIQYLLLKLGSELGFNVWVARNNKYNKYNETEFSTIPRILMKLPIRFDEATIRTIEMIDVLWLQGNSITAAFEVEHTTSIYSGLLRMSDLLVMQPDINIKLYIVSHDSWRNKVFNEINRPTFANLKTKKPLSEVCRYISYDKLKESVAKYDDLTIIKPEIIDKISESCIPNEG